MGGPCNKDHPTMRTPTGRKCKVPRKRCNCDFPDGPIHAAYNPKLNLAENVFAELDRQLMKNKRADAEKGKHGWFSEPSEEPSGRGRSGEQ